LERDIIKSHLDKWGEDKCWRIYKDAFFKNFKNLKTLDEALDDEGEIKPKCLGMTDEQMNEHIKPMNLEDRKKFFTTHEKVDGLWIKK
jgi:hypothetical protein